jgi:putative acyl-CoA dehydrogenase
MAARTDTQAVFNQSPPYEDVDLYGSDRPLQEAVVANGAGHEAAALAAFGRHWGSAATFEQARLANENPPKLRAFDAQGRRLDSVEFHPAYHRLMAESVAAGLHASTWQLDASRAAAPAEVARAARYLMVAQVENGHMCPITMTRAAVAAFAAAPALVGMLMPKLLSRHYDPLLRPWREKIGITLGMGMTEKQGGTDVRANTSTAEPVGGGEYRITGHKWFMSAPMCDAFLVLAQAAGGLTCFFLPRFRPDGSINTLRLQRLKDKLGNRSNASSEVEFEQAYALRIGEEGAGIRTILSMVQLTRIDCAISSAGMMRAGVARALHHSRHRSVFGKPLASQPMMRAVLADMALEVEGALALVMRLCRSFDHPDIAAEVARARLLTPAAKYWVCKTAPALLYEAMECLGGNGYVEEGTLARLYREAPVNAIWEGSGNVMALDVLRAARRDLEAAHGTLIALKREAHGLPGVAAAAEQVEKILADPEAEATARIAVERLTQLAAAAALQEYAPRAAELFAETRLAASRGDSYGTASLNAKDIALLLGRVLPES